MTVISEFRHSLFRDSSPLNIKNIAPIHQYNVAQYIEFNPEKHKKIFDFVNNKIYKFDESKESVEESVKLFSTFMQEFASRNSGTMIEFKHPVKDYYVLAVFEQSNLPIDTIFYNVYHTYIRDSIYQKTTEEIQTITYQLIPHFHWVWFRKPGATISSKIIQRSLSWITLNPEINFHLWTNLKDEEEANEFLGEALKEVDTDNIFKNRVTVHYQKDLNEILKQFCFGISANIPEFKRLWGSYYEILNNSRDKSTMVIKTDIIRCMVLYMKGGWYSDINDTYCFVPLKYVVNNENKDLILLGADTTKLYNNYIMYTPKKNGVWLEMTMKIFKSSIELFKILKVKDSKFYIAVHFFLREFIKCIKENTHSSIMQRIVNKAATLTNIYNKEIVEMFKRCEIELNVDFHLNTNYMILFIRYLMEAVNPDSILYKKFVIELNQVKFYSTENNFITVLWKDSTDLTNVTDPSFGGFKGLERLYTTDYETLLKGPEGPEFLADIEFWSNKIIEPSVVYNTLIPCNIGRILHITNMGSYFINKPKFENDAVESEYLYPIPYCYVFERMCFLTALGHMGDGTACGHNTALHLNNKI